MNNGIGREGETKKVLITGSGGFIGRNLNEQLVDCYAITAPTHSDLDLADAVVVREYLEKGGFDVILHCATHNATRNSTKDISQTLENNLRYFSNLARCNDLFGKMIYFGSGAEYDKPNAPKCVDEDFFGRYVPSDAYGFSKYISSLIAEGKGNIYNLVVFGCFGKYEDWEIRFISNACAKAVHGMDITINQNVAFDYLHIDDLVKVVRHFIEAEELAFKRYNVCTGVVIGLHTLAELVREVSGKHIGIIVKQEGMGREYSGSNARLLEEIGQFNFTDLRQSIKELYGWYEENKDSINKQLLFTDK
jgi:GDP-L-fucose synthase